MTDAVIMFRPEKRQFSPLFAPSMADALADWCKREWSAGRQKAVARRFGLSMDEARTVCRGCASKSTLDRVWRAGGWELVLDVFKDVIGEGVDQALERQRRSHEARADRLSALRRALVPLAADPAVLGAGDGAGRDRGQAARPGLLAQRNQGKAVKP